MLGSYSTHDRYRRRARARFFRVAFFLAIIGTAAGAAWQAGIEQSKGNTKTLETQIESLTAEKAALEQKMTDQLAAVSTANTKYAQLQEQCSRNVPTGPLKTLSDMVQERLAAGISSDRLAFVISSTTRAAHDCEKPITRRFMLALQSYNRTAPGVSFGGGAVSVTGEGAATRSPEGKPENWFDPEKPVTLHFRDNAGREATASGKLPLSQSMVVGNSEYRFTVATGAKGFVEVTSTRCSFP